MTADISHATPVLAITVEGIKELIADHTTAHTVPYSVLLNPLDCEAIKDELNDHGTDPRSRVLGIVNGCLISAAGGISRGSARVLTRAPYQMPGDWLEKLVTMFRGAMATHPAAGSYRANLQTPFGLVPIELDGESAREMTDVELRIALGGAAAREGVAH